MVHTIESVKETLPKVQIKVDGKIVTANISNPKAPFAFVWIGNNKSGWTVCWSAIVVSLNSENPIRV